MTPIELTKYSKGSGCGCKIAPEPLEKILSQSVSHPKDPAWAQLNRMLAVGHGTNDDAAVMDLGNGQGLISTVDFFTPIVDDPYDFGRIAATNALSDVYSMGGKPIMALALLGWPLDKLSVEAAAEVVRGGRDVCKEVGIPLAGGHSVDVPEPLFGLSVNGLIPMDRIKKNQGAQAGDALYLTKPLGVGMVASGLKKGIATPEDQAWALETMLQKNSFGTFLGTQTGVHALTDVTGFGLVGHLWEMLDSSHVSATLYWEAIPALAVDRFTALVQAFCMPEGTTKNFQAYKSRISTLTGPQLMLLCDPQTSGGLLASVHPSFEAICAEEAKKQGTLWVKVGEIRPNTEDQCRIELASIQMDS